MILKVFPVLYGAYQPHESQGDQSASIQVSFSVIVQIGNAGIAIQAYDLSQIAVNCLLLSGAVIAISLLVYRKYLK